MAPLDHRGRSYEVNVLGGVMLTAFGLGIAFPTVSIAVTAGIPARQQGVAGGLFVTAQQVGTAAGLAVLATIADSGDVHPSGYHTPAERMPAAVDATRTTRA